MEQGGTMTVRRQDETPGSWTKGLAVLAMAASVGLALGQAPAAAHEAGRLQPVSGSADAAATANDPLQIVVSLRDQRLDLYRGTERIETTRISSGKSGYGTPAGVFSILEKRRRHFSNLYDNAPMPYMQRITWSGVALHEGRVPNYPASHGCIRLPKGFAAKLYGMTSIGAHVVIVRNDARPEDIRHPVLPRPAVDEPEVAALDVGTLRGPIGSDAGIVAVLPGEAKAERPTDPLRVVIKAVDAGERIRDMQRVLDRLGYAPGPADGVFGPKTRAALKLFQEGAELPITGIPTDFVLRALYAEAGEERPMNARLLVRRKFREIFSAPVELRDPDRPTGTHLYTALDFGPEDREVRWMAVTAEATPLETSKSVLDRITLSQRAEHFLAENLTPGSSILVTDRPFRLHSGLGTDFIVTTR